MKITLTNGVVIELSGIEEIDAVLPSLSGMSAPETDSTDQDEARIAAGEILTALIKPASHRVRRTRIPNPPAPSGRWPDLIYLTVEWNQTFEVLKAYHPEPLSSEELAIELGVEHAIASGYAGRIRKHTPLIVLVDGKFSLTKIGQDPTLQVQISPKPSIDNKKLGWDRFMAIPLPDGRNRRRRRRS